MNDKHCIFCNCKDNPKEAVLFENTTATVRLDQAPAVPGHMEVLPKRHCELLTDVTTNEWVDILEGIKTAKRLAAKLDFKSYYIRMLKDPAEPEFNNFIERVLASPFLGKKPEGGIRAIFGDEAY